MGLSLNVSKTIAFDLHAIQPYLVDEVKVSNEPVKYLGSFLGIGPQVEQKNFENIWSKMQVKIHQWWNRGISLQA